MILNGILSEGNMSKIKKELTSLNGGSTLLIYKDKGFLGGKIQ